MTSLMSRRNLLMWRNRADGSPVGRRNATVAAVRAFEPSRPKQPGRRVGPAVKPRAQRVWLDEAQSSETQPAEEPKRHGVRDALGRFVRRVVNDQ